MDLYSAKPLELMTSAIIFAASHWIILFRELSGVFYAKKSTAQKKSVGGNLNKSVYNISIICKADRKHG